MSHESQRFDRRTTLKALGAASLAGLAGCTSDGSENDSGGAGNDGGGGGSTASGGSNSEPLKVGILAPLSGGYARDGKNVVQGCKSAVKTINEAGGINGVEVESVVGDTQTDPKKAVDATRNLVNQKDVHVLTGGLSSAVALGIGKVANQLEVPYIGGTGAEGARKEDCGKYFFVDNPNYLLVSRAPTQWLHENTDMSSIYVIALDYNVGHQQAKAIKEYAANQNDLEVRGVSFASSTTSDTSGIVSKALDSGADTLIGSLWGNAQIRFLNTLFSFDPYEKIDRYAINWSNTDFIKGMNDPSQIEGTYSFGPYYWNLDNERNQAFVDTYQQNFGRVPNQTAYMNHTGTLQLLKAAKAAGSYSPDDVASALEGRTYKAPKGHDGKIRACDHEWIEDVVALRGRPPDEKTNPDDYFEHLGWVDGQKNTPECSPKCGGPFFS